MQPLPPNDVGMMCLSALVSSEKGATVTLADFGRSTRFFPPFGPEALKRMQDVLSAGWFHGPISPQDADLALGRARKPGCYLIRYASDEEARPDQALLMLCVAGHADGPQPIEVSVNGYSYHGEHYD